MIPTDELSPIGRFVKPHGIKGEISAATDYDADTLRALPCIFLCIDGLYVPFFIESVRERGQGALLLTIDGIDTQQQAAAIASKDFYAKSSDLPEEEDTEDGGFYLDDLIGYTVNDGPDLVGTVTDYDDSTANVLLLVERPDGRTVHIPAAAELFEAVDADNKTIIMNLPEGITEL